MCGVCAGVRVRTCRARARVRVRVRHVATGGRQARGQPRPPSWGCALGTVLGLLLGKIEVRFIIFCLRFFFWFVWLVRSSTHVNRTRWQASCVFLECGRHARPSLPLVAPRSGRPPHPRSLLRPSVPQFLLRCGMLLCVRACRWMVCFPVQHTGASPGSAAAMVGV